MRKLVYWLNYFFVFFNAGACVFNVAKEQYPLAWYHAFGCACSLVVVIMMSREGRRE